MDARAQQSEILTPAVERVLDCLPRAVMVRGLDGAVLGWNASAEEMFGWSRAEALGRPMAELLVLPGDLQAAREIVEVAVAGSVWSGEFSVLRSDGDTVRITAHVAPLRDESGEVVATISAVENVTEIRLAEHRAADMADHLLLALAAGDLGTWRWDLATGLTTWDETMARLFGRDLTTFDGGFETWRSCLHPDDVDETVAAVEAAVEATSSYELEHRVVWSDGTVHWVLCRGKVTVDLDGNATGTIGVASDITERKQGELQVERRVAEAERSAAAERLARERLEFLADISSAALQATSHQDLMATVTAAAVPRLGDWCAIHFIGQANTPPLVEAAHSDPAKVAWVKDLQAQYPFDPDAPTGVAAVIRSGEHEVVQVDQAFIEEAVRQTTIMPESEARAIADALRLTSLITVPLHTSRGVVGAIQFVSAESGRRYDQDDVSLAIGAAALIGAALDNAWLADEYRTMANDLQEALLPVDLPTIDGIDIAVRYWAAGAVNEVGGDFYDVFASAPGRWSVVVGDVCGTGPQAAAVTAKARHTIRAAATHGAGHVEILEWVNDAILASHRGRFCTIVYTTLERNDDATWTMRVVAGGHPLPIIIDRHGVTRTVGRHGTLIGVLNDLRLEVEEITISDGDTVVLYTDGITDVPPPHGLDEVQLEAVVSRAVVGAASSEDACDRLGAELAAVLPFAQRDDDMAIVALRFSDLSPSGDSVVVVP